MFFVVYRGFTPGIYTNSDELDKQIKNFNNPIFKKCTSLDDARYFLKNGISKENKKYTIHTTNNNKPPSFKSSSILDFFKEKQDTNERQENDEKCMYTLIDKMNDKLINKINNNEIIVYTDGSCIKRRYNEGGCGIHFPNNEFADISEKFLQKPITNQRSELYSIFIAINTIIHHDIYKNYKIIIYSDSEYSIHSLSKWCKGWESNKWRRSDNSELKNLDIIIPLYELYKKYNISLIHVRSHCGITGNEIADKLARAGADSSTTTS